MIGFYTLFHQAAPNPTQNVPFNLNLTPSQQESRAQVPLPYVHEGKYHILCNPSRTYSYWEIFNVSIDPSWFAT